MRVDAARWPSCLGSHTVAASLSADGRGRACRRCGRRQSDRLHEGAWLEGHAAGTGETTGAEGKKLVEGMDILHFDDDLIAVHKPVGGSRTPPSAGKDRLSWEAWQRPVSHIRRRPAGTAGNCATLDVGTSGVMVVAASGAWL